MAVKASLSLPQLRALAEAGEIDTVIVAVPDMQGRLVGKRVMPRFFIEHVSVDGMEACANILATDIECGPVKGYGLASWEKGYGDLVLVPDIDTLRRASWQVGAAIILCDVELAAGVPVEVAPRTILKRQVARLAERGLVAMAATELEFLLFRNSYEEAWDKGYRGLAPGNQYNNDYSILGTARVEPVLRAIRNVMEAAGVQVEYSKGECNLGQHEVNFVYRDVVGAADGHVVYKEAAKEVAAEHGCALTFMAKFDEREGNSCHTHLSLRDLEGHAVFMDGRTRGHSVMLGHFLAGILIHAEELALFYAPNVNSYKRYVGGRFAPTALVWGEDNRTCALRVVGRGKSLRVENRLPGGDVNPYLVLAGMIAAGLDGMERELKPPPAYEGNAYVGKQRRVPRSLAAAVKVFGASVWNKAVFGEDVVAHYVNMAAVELAAFEAAVTDWEKYRSFERM